MPDNVLCDHAINIGKYLQDNRMMLVTAESCTGGWIAQAVTDIAGSSAWFERGFVTYSNASKQSMLGVRAETLDAFGAVSEQVALEMAKGALQHSLGDISIAVTGIAGPDGGSADKPVGTVWIACATKEKVLAQVHHFEGDREEVRRKTVIAAMEMVLGILPPLTSR